MSTQKTNITARRVSQLLAMDERIFHLKDLATLWGIENYNTLRTTIKRYCQNGLLYSIYKGFYSVLPVEKIDTLLLGVKAIHGYCYLSTESILFSEGYISRKVTYFTFVGEKSTRFFIGKNQYMSRQLKSTSLFNPEGISTKNGMLQANIYRAIADMLYFSPKYHFDKEINWKMIQEIQRKIGYPLTPNRYAHP